MDVTYNFDDTAENCTSSTVVNIFHAAEEDDESAIRYFIEKEGVRLTDSNYDDETAAHIAARNGNVNIINILLNRDPTIISQTNGVGDTPLFVAIENGQLHVVKLFVERYKADIAEKNYRVFGCTPIHMAAKWGQLEILKYFVEERKGNVNVRNKLKETPVFFAAENKHHHIMKYLVEEAHANLTKVDRNKDNVLYSTIKGNDLTLMKYLLDDRKIEFDVNYRNGQGVTLVHHAAKHNRIDFLTYLVEEKKADVNIPDTLNTTSLHSAALRDHFQVCKYLVEHGADVDFKDFRGMPPAHYASDHQLIQYMKNVTQKRDRRSVFEPVSPLSTRRTLLPSEKGWRIIAELSSSNSISRQCEGPFSSLGSYHFQSILMAAQIVFRTTKNSLSHLSLLSPTEIVKRRINPVALMAVQTAPRIEKLRAK